MRIASNLSLSFPFTHGKKAWFLNHVNDEFVKKAQAYNFRSRASFKLLQIEEKYKLIQKNSSILDLGSAPGSWSQAAQFINPAAKIAAVDLLPMKELENVDFYQVDARSQTLHKILKEKYGKFQVIMSDMAPNFSGTLFQTHEGSVELNKLCLQLCLQLGTEGCHLVMKTIQGQMQKPLLNLLQLFFTEVQRFKPKASRKESAEHYIVCRQLKTMAKEGLIEKLEELVLSSQHSKKKLKDYFQLN